MWVVCIVSGLDRSIVLFSNLVDQSCIITCHFNIDLLDLTIEL